MKDSIQCNPIYGWKDSSLEQDLNMGYGTVSEKNRSVFYLLSYRAPSGCQYRCENTLIGYVYYLC